MADILNDPVKVVMLIILAALEIPAAIALAIMWTRAKNGGGTNDRA